MSAKTHPRLLGAFVLGAIALVLAAVVFFSAGGWLQKRERFSVYFPGSVRGLNPGALVTFRGIKIGEVAEVKAVLTGKPDPLIQIEIVFELMSDVLEAPPGVPRPFAGLTARDVAKALIDRGVRGKLQSQSLLTGQKYIDFDFLPDEPPRFSGLNPRYPELPTTPTAMEKLGDKFEQFFDKLAELPLDEMMEDVRKAIRSVREVVEAPELRGAIRKADRAMGELCPDPRGGAPHGRPRAEAPRHRRERGPGHGRRRPRDAGRGCERPSTGPNGLSTRSTVRSAAPTRRGSVRRGPWRSSSAR